MNKIKFMMLAMIAMLTLGFASCSSSSDDSNSPAQPSSKVQSAELQFDFTVAEDLASLIKFTLEWYDEDGNLQSQVVDGKQPIQLDVKYNLAKAKILGCRITCEYTNAKIDPDKTYMTYCYCKNPGILYVVNGEQKSEWINTPFSSYESSTQWFKTKEKLHQFAIRHYMTGTLTFFYKVTDTGLERVKNN